MLNPEDYTVGLVCNIELETTAVDAVLDERHWQYDDDLDNVHYKLGKIGAHHVVIAVPQGSYWTDAHLETSLCTGFPNLTFVLSVGLGAGHSWPAFFSETVAILDRAAPVDASPVSINSGGETQSTTTGEKPLAGGGCQQHSHAESLGTTKCPKTNGGDG
ncbi:hypothetical protein NLG97_g9048 [Lecanicillium saksenae]|uniref:Uncharacterized protein n=1 Tax=Lecanicillium saksenae TaxID=468837 RepID=A0ACC1QHC5_9HYPO|nr:hypothetical protein NLG97_g9048 [Lecanicillium saksenae]